MPKKTDPHPADQTALLNENEALRQRIQQLEQSIERFESRSRPEIPAKRHREIGLIKNNWLIPFGQYLLIDSDNANLEQALERLGQLFTSAECSLWRMKSNHLSAQSLATSSWYCLGNWSKNSAQRLQEADWLTALWRNDHEFAQQLAAGETIALLAADPAHAEASAALQSKGIFSSLIVPVLRYQNLEGCVIIHRDHPTGWFTRDIDRLKFIATALINLYDRRQLLKKLSDRETRFNYALEASSDGLWDWNIKTGQIYFSRSYLRMLGYNYENLPGNLTTLKEYFLYRDDADMVMQRYDKAIADNEAQVNLQFRMQHQNGSILWVQSRAKFYEPDDTGKHTRCVGLNNDITNFIKAHEELLAAKSQADLANQTKTEFLARMSHEIRTPMNAIIGLGYLLKDTSLDQQQKSYLSSLNSASDSLLHIINEILDFSKIDSGKIVLDQAHFDLEQVFEKITRLFEISAAHKPIRIIYDISPEVPRFLRGDAARLSQIIGHLINNVLKYAVVDEVVVAVSLKKANMRFVELEFSVKDFGVGMSQGRLQKVRESLAQQGSISDANGRKFGLGICSHLVGLMKGELHIDSQLNEGCRVSFNALFDNSRLGPQHIAVESRVLSNIHALIVDDNLIARTVMATTARNTGLQVEEVESGELAIEKILQADAKHQPFHFILMDYRMPYMTGTQSARIIKSSVQLNYSPHIILVSAYRRDEISKGDSEPDCVEEFLSKPVSESRLLETITQVISKDPRLQKISCLHEEKSAIDAALNNIRVLVAEDNLVNQQVVRGVLKKKNIQVVVANNGLDAVNAIENAEQAFDLVLMDLEMPEMDGIEATRKIRAGHKAPQIPIVALTAQAMRGDRERCLEAGMTAYLSKPINPELLYKTIAEQIKPRLESSV